MQYKELKAWFRANMDDLPGTLKIGCKNYQDVKKFAELNISQIDTEISRLKNKIKHSKLARSSKTNLIELYNELISENEKKYN